MYAASPLPARNLQSASTRLRNLKPLLTRDLSVSDSTLRRLPTGKAHATLPALPVPHSLREFDESLRPFVRIARQARPPTVAALKSLWRVHHRGSRRTESAKALHARRPLLRAPNAGFLAPPRLRDCLSW